ncbi:tetratricopeptide repeat protein [Mangrovicoccus ximenensis]|uniref:tetratricopeptide repeat protein n=1 Tax=Mangrovicoccus ximenensis TaxID=1911570 RepID=UPI001F2932C9|nr:tetratricopeptide repeat protein [Mangrovicoccus ximenensis]
MNGHAAAQAFAEVTTLDPQHVDAWVMRARLAAALDGPDAARQLLEQAVAANPGDLGLSTLLAELGGPAPDLTPPR